MIQRASRRRVLKTISAVTIAGGGGIRRTRGQTSGDEQRDQETLTEFPDGLFRGGLKRQGYDPEATTPDTLEIDWRVDGVNKSNYAAAKASPVAAPTGDIVIPGDTGTVYAITPEGDTRWAAATDPSANGIHGTPAIANGTVYVGAYDGALYAFDVETGERRWRSEVGDFIGSSPAYYDGTVYTAVEFWGPDGSVAAVDATTGDLEWEGEQPTSHPHSTLAIDRDADKLVVGSNDGYLYAWDFTDREYAWKFNTGRPIKGPIATYDGSAFFGSWDYNVYRVDLETGEEAWDMSFTTDYTVMSGPSIDTDDGVVYVGSNDNSLYAIDAESGDELWEYSTGDNVMGCPKVTAERVLFGSRDTHLYALDKVTGEHVADVDTSGRVTSTPIVVDDGIYFTNRATQEDSGGFYRVAASD